jgi:hypothetical protein
MKRSIFLYFLLALSKQGLQPRSASLGPKLSTCRPLWRVMSIQRPSTPFQEPKVMKLHQNHQKYPNVSLTPTENGIVNQPGVKPAIQQVASPAEPAKPCPKSIFHGESSVFHRFLRESIIFHGKTLCSDWHRFRDDVGMTNASVT